MYFWCSSHWTAIPTMGPLRFFPQRRGGAQVWRAAARIEAQGGDIGG